MPIKAQLVVSPKTSSTEYLLLQEVSNKLDIPINDIAMIIKEKESLDARQLHVKVNLSVLVIMKDEEIPSIPDYDRFLLQNVDKSDEVLIIGSGPAGLFSALQLIELGKKPIIIERGKAIEDRKIDVAQLNTQGILNSDSNWCYGEGGAGTFTDGKLLTRSNKRGNINKVINTFIEFGAEPEIKYSSHPHIGTDKLPEIIKGIRNRIIECGGEIKFNSKLTDIIIKAGEISSIEINNSETIKCNKLILSCGHSARDIYEILNKREVFLEPKSFAIGVRIEHPQQIINEMQYHTKAMTPYLPTAEYSFAEQVEGRGAYSFCMCPGGVVVPAATSEGELVVNGMSNSKRTGQLANSGFVVEVRVEDIPGFESNVFAGIEYQRNIEKQCFIAGGSDYKAPAQRMLDFIKGKNSSELPDSSYYRGITSMNLNHLLPKNISQRLAAAFSKIKSKKKAFLTNSAVLIAPETRTSSPLFIKRDKETLESVNVKGLYPCGEGSGYSGGISSAAIDGMNCAGHLCNNH